MSAETRRLALPARFVLAVFAMLFLFAFPAQAAGRKGIVTTDAVAYASPVINDRIAGYCEAGITVTVTETRNGFYRISEDSYVAEDPYTGTPISNGEGAWIPAHYVYLTGTDTSALRRMGEGTAQKETKVYAKPKDSSAVFGVIKSGAVRNLYLQSGDWYMIYTGGRFAWVRSADFYFTKAVGGRRITQAILTANAQMRVGPGEEFPVQKRLPEGTVVNVYEISGNYMKVYKGGAYFWVDSAYLYDLAKGDPGINDRIGRGVTVKKTLIYEKPGTRSKVLGSIPSGRTRNLYAQSGNWYQIYSNGRFAWVRADAFDFTESSARVRVSVGKVQTAVRTHYGAGEDYETVLQYKPGTAVNIYAQTRSWYLLYRGGKYVWAPSWYFGSVRAASSGSYLVATPCYQQLNEFRAADGLSPLVRDAKLEQLAKIRAKELVELYSHVRPNGDTGLSIIPGYGWKGENIGRGAGLSTCTAIMAGWYNSGSHRDNMLSENYRRVGIAGFTADGVYYWVQLFAS